MKDIKLTYIISVFDEVEQFKGLLDLLSKHVNFHEQELIVVIDPNSLTKESTNQLDEFYQLYTDNMGGRPNITKLFAVFEGDMSTFKNIGIEMAEGDYIVNLRSYDRPSEKFLKYITFELEDNINVDYFNIKRKDIVYGITSHHLKEWDWTQDENRYINRNDTYPIIFRNDNRIKWSGHSGKRLSHHNGMNKLLPDAFYIFSERNIWDVEKEFSKIKVPYLQY